MFVRRASVLALLGALPLFLINCSSDDPGQGTGGTASTAGSSTGGTGGSSAGTAAGGMATGGLPTAGTGGVQPSGGASGSTSGGSSAGGATGGGGSSAGGATGGGGSSAGGATGGGGSGGSGGGSGGGFKLTSAEIMDGQPIPAAHTCTGKGGVMDWGIAPSLKWENPPAGTMSYAFFMIDWTLTMKTPPDVNGYHSAAWNIPTTITSLPKDWNVMDDLGGAKAINGGYLGPCPPSGTDTYHLIIMAMPMASYNITANGTMGVRSTYDTFKAAALGIAEVTGTYVRP